MVTEYALCVEVVPSYIRTRVYRATISTGSGQVFEWLDRVEAEAVYQAYLLMQRECEGAES